MQPLLKAAGTDASKQYDAFHNASILEKLGAKYYIGDVGEAPPAESATANTDDVEGPFGDLVPFGDPYWYADWGSPYYNDSHRRVRKAMRDFTEKEIMPYCYEWDEAKQVPKALYTKCAQAGILAAIVGPHLLHGYKGPTVAGIPLDQLDAFHEFIVCDELSRCGSGGVLWGLIGGLGIGLPPVLAFGSQELRKKVLEPCLSGEKTMCLAITEPYAGSDVANIQCEARESADGDHYIVNGEKVWMPAVSICSRISIEMDYQWSLGGLFYGGCAYR